MNNQNSTANEVPEQTQNGWINLQTKQTTLETIDGPGLHDRYAIVYTDKDPLILRNDKSKEASYVLEIEKGSYVWAIRTEQNTLGENWTEVVYQKDNAIYQGYVSSQYLRLLPQEESNIYDQSQPSPVPSNMKSK